MKLILLVAVYGMLYSVGRLKISISRRLPARASDCLIFQRTAPTGLQHGTVTVMLAQGTYEVTTFRKEAEYEGFRRPASVAYISDLTEDLKRRDFTMNAMAMDGAGDVIDPFGGQKDLAVGRAPLRRQSGGTIRRRCAAHASLYSFRLDLRLAGRGEHLAGAAGEAPLLRHIAMERVRSELQRMVEGPAPARAVRLLLASRLMAHLKKQLPLPFERWLAWDDALDAVSALEEQHDRWAMLLMLLEVPADVVRTALQELTFSRADGAAVAAVLGPARSCRRAGHASDPAPLERVWKLGAVRSGDSRRPRAAAAAACAAAGHGQRGELALLLGSYRAGAAAARGGLAEARYPASA